MTQNHRPLIWFLTEPPSFPRATESLPGDLRTRRHIVQLGAAWQMIQTAAKAFATAEREPSWAEQTPPISVEQIPQVTLTGKRWPVVYIVPEMMQTNKGMEVQL